MMEDVLQYDDAVEDDPGGTGAGIVIPEDIPPEPDFLTRFHNRFKDMLQSSNPNFTEFESLVTDFINTIKTELHFKPNPST